MSTETTPTICGHSFTYDGFGNRTNQTLTKGSGPTHSIAIDATTNRINGAGYGYDANGNLTQMPLMTMTYDVANRMVSPRHSRAGNGIYGYNHAMQRAQKPGPDGVRSGYTVTYYLYGTGLDYAWNRYYSPTTGRFTTADPYAGSGRSVSLESRKRYTYVGNYPIAYFDPIGLLQLRPLSEGSGIPTRICNYDPRFCNEDYKPDVGIDTRLIAQTRHDEQDSQCRAFEKDMEREIKWLQRALDTFGKQAKCEPSTDECKNALNSIGVTPNQINGTARITKWMPLIHYRHRR